jgi:HEAT repeat protein
VAAGAGSTASTAAAANNENAIAMEPLVLRPPRVGLSETAIAQTINQKLELLIQQKISLPMDPTLQQDSNFQDLNRLVTPEGFALQTRYSNLSVAVAEGLAGTKDPILRADLRRIAQGDTNPVARATALVSMAYAREDEDVTLVRTSLSDPDPIVRFGAMEAAQVGRFKVVPALQSIAADDQVPAFRVFALQVLLSLNEPSAYDGLVSNLDNDDWPARAMAIWYLGRYGKDTDYSVLLNSINREKNPFVLAEIALAVQRLAPPGK